MTYLFTGPETGEKEKKILEIRRSFQSGSVDFHKFYAFETSLSEALSSSLLTPSLFSSAVVTVFYNSELLKKKEDAKILKEWSESEAAKSASHVLILVSEEVKLESNIEKYADEKRIFWQMFEEKKALWLSSLFSKAGFKITGEAAQLFLERIENDSAALTQAANRFFVFFDKGKTVTAEDVEEILAHEKGEDAFSLFDSLATSPKSECLCRALRLLFYIRLSKEFSFVSLIAALRACFRKLILFHELKDKGETDGFSLKKNGFLSAKMQKLYQKASKVWSKNASRRALASLCEVDKEIRNGADEKIMCELLVYSLAVKHGEMTEKYEKDWKASFY